MVRSVAHAIVREAQTLTHNTTLLSLEPRGLSRVQAAGYLGVSSSLFDQMVGDGRMPLPKIINSRRVWDRRELDASFEGLPRKEEPDPWDSVCV